ncbi:pyridoxal phosphate-dependent aminotransferase [Colwellia sp. MB02u-18]|uniref:pyridoxal phosphate-dependent aminotransferase n=1 Tax=unclassified Colwellia TaxID=196834 RepID=UPI0015F6774D|nr:MULTISPECIES: pyridoxal phosphate-dependent aminotransferase [unclassified Colwellia]MBA6225045.1 pyridoxal phosphate-dependent aminotransferase [Colwellia sp. MB3u-45]MBA6268667.1 pyridoxal phosphate-dependent aminotransferase [Colwellia sp. MB3u-43]MBA6321098.1 pyridoxal phosphate-dependent aminotransferase [Colwellia sp. MB02u-19]MBA6325651.1 pyridoxal phosphate-dependent aminotransferase [Colwellia sp. MB02u-18]MBA6332126.1 pyridoxal phosphate-dependent aminotransferase [Colwellia sp. M
MKTITKSSKLKNVYYEIRGQVAAEAKRLEDEGYKILKLNIGNPAPFGFEAPDDILKDVIRNLPTAQGYCESKGIYPARVAIMQYFQQQGILDVSVDDIYIGNGVSELIVMAMQGLLDNGDEVLIPAPDYPLWTAAVALSGGKPVHYRCDEENQWFPDLEDIASKISSKTKALVLINPNNPTGAVYSEEVLQGIITLAREHNLIIFSDEIYDKILYDQAQHIPTARLANDVLIITMGGLSKNYRIAGFRAGWMVITGPKIHAEDYLKGLDILSSMRLCANVPAQHAIQTALGGYQSINELIKNDGRLLKQRNLAHKMINEIDGLSCNPAMGALYLFVKVDQEKFNIHDDEKMVLDLLKQEKILLVHGRAFNIKQDNYFRLVFLPHVDELKPALEKLAKFFRTYRQSTSE